MASPSSRGSLKEMEGPLRANQRPNLKLTSAAFDAASAEAPAPMSCSLVRASDLKKEREKGSLPVFAIHEVGERDHT